VDILIIGAGGHSKIVIDILEENDQKIIGLLDDDTNLHNEKIMGYDVLGSIGLINEYDKNEIGFIISIGNNKVRRKLYTELISKGYKPVSAISNDAKISKYAELGEGLIINAGVVTHPDVQIKDNVIIGMNATVSHDTLIESNVHISPGVHLTGNTYIEDGVDIGTGAMLKPGVSIGKNTIVGAGAVLIDDLEANSIYAGVPAKKIRDL